ncbi:MAG: PorT family protein [Bacteroidetes bacterium]|nr:PorT family protein [Bacteroidota bacterium]
MKKICIVALFILFIIAQPGKAQYKPFIFGIRVSPNLSWVIPDAKYYAYEGVKPGFSFGFISDFALADNYFISTGFSYSYLYGKISFPFEDTMEEVLVTGTCRRQINFRNLEVPLMFKMKTNEFGQFRFFAQIGFGTSFRLSAKANDEVTTEDQEVFKQRVDITRETTLLKESLLVGIGAEYYFDESTALVAGINYSNGLTNVLKGRNSKYNEVEQKGVNHYFDLTIGVLF